MSDHHYHRRLLYLLVAAMFLAAVAVTFVKVRYFGFTLDNASSYYYQVDTAISFEPTNGAEVQISLAVPETAPGWSFAPDPQNNRVFRLESSHGFPRIRLDAPPCNGRQTVDFRYRILPDDREFPLPHSAAVAVPPPVISDEIREAAAAFLKEWPEGLRQDFEENLPALLRKLGALPPAEKQKLTSLGGVEGTVDAAVLLLGLQDIPARAVRYIRLDERKSTQQTGQLLDVRDPVTGDWRLFRPNTGLEEPAPEELLILQRRDHSLLEVMNARNSQIRFAVTRVPAGARQLNEMRGRIVDGPLSRLTLFSLPASEQNMFQRLSLLPLAILLIVLTRNIVGIQTMGTFMPVLIAMSFLEMRLLPGLVNFVLILTVGLGVRSWLSRLNLLMVPRISAVVVFVILLMQLISLAANWLKQPDFMAVTYFPLIIIAWTIERASTVWEEDGARNTLKQLAASLGTAAVSYLILSSRFLQYILYTFGELNLIILGVILLLGTYTGYRATELFRFQPLTRP